jgi:hypothetical protein
MSQRRNTTIGPSRRRHIAVGALSLVALAACSADRMTAPAAVPSQDASLGKGEDDKKAKDAGKRLTPTQLEAAAPTFRTTSADIEAPADKPLPLSCGFTGRYMVSQRIGKGGGSLKFGRSEFKVPAGALTSDVQVTADISIGQEGVEVNFGPHGLKFAKAAELRVDYTGCTAPTGAALNVYYTDGYDRIVQTMPSAMVPGAPQIRSLTDHFSGYVVSWGRTAQ